MINVEKILKAISTYKIYEFSEYNPLGNEYTYALKLFEETLMSYLFLDETFDDEVQTRLAVEYLKSHMYCGVSEVERASYLILNEAYGNSSMATMFNEAEYELYTKECETIEAVINLTKTKIERKTFIDAVYEVLNNDCCPMEVKFYCETLKLLISLNEFDKIRILMHMLEHSNCKYARLTYKVILLNYRLPVRKEVTSNGRPCNATWLPSRDSTHHGMVC